MLPFKTCRSAAVRGCVKSRWRRDAAVLMEGGAAVQGLPVIRIYLMQQTPRLRKTFQAGIARKGFRAGPLRPDGGCGSQAQQKDKCEKDGAAVAAAAGAVLKINA